MISFLLPLVGAMIPSLLVGVLAALVGVWLLGRGWHRPGIALLAWAVVRAIDGLAGVAFSLFQYGLIQGGNVTIPHVAWLAAYGVVEGLGWALSIGLLVYAALCDRGPPTEAGSGGATYR